jgi:hypothetical protein
MVPIFKFGIQNTQLRILFQAVDFSRLLKGVDDRPRFDQNCKLDHLPTYYYVVLEGEIFSFNLNDRLNETINWYSEQHYS